ncbi:hypothetical protein [Streptoalloteichus tenebrarius]|uniref:hypothetical protein n=1 Tax=Streptoalloteichus tenebrarius (strain ATCC 17920 / DSM 40477 / JCM 4838 / CBS 697.72 / NBRC 16177 / NCIMB 11028 / NRRL B-12390 / A12253. 1 / ISP 5477) TaxID=1933 RepID=UPI0036D22110
MKAFHVVGETPDGVLLEWASASPVAVARAAATWRARYGLSAVRWGVRGDVGAGEPVTVLVRYLPGVVGETRRVVHMVRLAPGEFMSHHPRACCGTVLRLTLSEICELGEGVPCERCLAATLRREVSPGRPAPVTPIRQELASPAAP